MDLKRLSQKAKNIRPARIAARRAWTDSIKADQLARGIYREPEGDEEFRELTITSNQNVFGTRDFGHNRDTMSLPQQVQITRLERQMSGQAYRGTRLPVIVDGLKPDSGKAGRLAGLGRRLRREN
jgi:hypothetical protein